MGKRKKKAGKQEKGVARLRAALPRCLAWAGVLALVAVAVSLGASRLWAAVSGRPEFTLDASALSFHNCPPCGRRAQMASELRKQLSAAIGGRSVFDEDLCRRVEERLRAGPCFWIREVKSVRRLLPDRLELEMVFREPAALVQFGPDCYMIDADGYWLPDHLYLLPEGWDTDRIPVIVNRKLRTSPPLARGWSGPALAVGARLHMFLLRSGLFDELPMKTLDVTHVGEAGYEPDIVLTARNGVAIKWGCSDSYAQLEGLSLPSGRNPDSRKLEMLRTKMGDYPGLEGLNYIDLRWVGKISVSEGRQAAGPREAYARTASSASGGSPSVEFDSHPSYDFASGGGELRQYGSEPSSE